MFSRGASKVQGSLGRIVVVASGHLHLQANDPTSVSGQTELCSPIPLTHRRPAAKGILINRVQDGMMLRYEET